MEYDYLLTSIVVILLPGTGVLYTLAVGLGQGSRSSVIAAFGCTLGIVPHMLASIVGLAAILHASAIAFEIIRYIGVAYLFYMAWNMLRDGGPLTIEEGQKHLSALKIIRGGILLNVLNPKLSLFFLAFLPQFIPSAETNPTPTMILLALVFMGLTFIVFVGYGLCAAQARDFIVSKPNVVTWLKRGFAGTFALLGTRLALTD
jgi:threonine/homoserine/homoserine lactone efflux protein